MPKDCPLICPYPYAKDIYSFLYQDLGCSRAFLKRHGITKNQTKLQKEVRVSPNVLNAQMISPIYTGAPVEILYEDDDFLVLNKPKKIHCHPLQYLEEDNLLSFLRSKKIFCPLKLSPLTHEKGLLHRIDYETSGIVALAKNEKVHKLWRQHWKSSLVTKVYWAKVNGHISESKDIFHKLNLSTKKVKESQVEGVSAQIKVIPQSFLKDENTTLVKVFLKEGHRHQIRVQLSLIGHPIIGDPLYGNPRGDSLQLHHARLELEGCLRVDCSHRITWNR